MRIGNVIKAPGGDLWIVTAVNDRTVSAVSLSAENVDAIQRLEDTTKQHVCPDCDGEGQECENCHGTGSIVVTHTGWGKATVEAPHVRAFILNGARKLWGI